MLRSSGFVKLRINESPFDDGKFITRTNFWNEQALSADVIYNEAVHAQRSTADSTENQTQR